MYQFGNETELIPFDLAGIGDIRDSQQGHATNQFGWVAGGGVMYRLNNRLSRQTIPVEYVMNTTGGNVGNNFLARAGFAVTIPK